MKKLIYEVMTIAVVISFAGNTFATVGNGSGSNPIQQNITSDQLNKLIDSRLNNPNKYRNNDPILLNLKKNPIAEGVQASLKNNSVYQIIISNKSADNYGKITDPETGSSFILKKSSRAEIDRLSPENISHTSALKNATKEAFGPYGSKMALETVTFYAGVGANNVFNLLTSYEKNPMALEQFIEELKDPVAQIGFAAFMIGNRYAQTILEQALKKSTNPTVVKTLAPMLGFLAMGVGSVFSNIANDLITLTKPCSVAMMNANKPEFDTPEKRAAICQEGWDAVMSSDNLARYVTSVMSVVGSAVISAFLTQGYKSGMKVVAKTYGLDSLYFIFRKIVPARKPIQGLVNAATVVGAAPERMTLKSIGIGIADLVIFLQADEFLNPYVHHLVESVGNSGPKLSYNNRDINYLLEKLDEKNWSDGTEIACSRPFVERASGTVQRDYSLCRTGFSPLYDSLSLSHEKNQKWREVLSYDFMTSYNNWVRFIAEFTVMHQISREYFSQIIGYTASKDEDIRTNSPYYNPLIHDNPFYGVLASEKVPIQDELEYRSVNKSKSQRILESLALVNKALAFVYYRNKTDEFVNPLVQIKKNIEIYKKAPVEVNEKYLVTALEQINSLDQKAKNLAALERSSRDRVTMGVQYEYRKSLMDKIGLITAIRTYIGNPTPLKKGIQSFFTIFNDWVKKEKPDYVKLFDEKGSPAETITWYAVCGNNLDKKGARVDRRRSAVSTSIDNGINSLFAATNALTNWVAAKTNTTNDLELRTDVAPALKTFESIRFGTGVDFYVPKIVNGDMSRYCEAAGKNSSVLPMLSRPAFLSLSILPGKKVLPIPSIKGPDNKEYDSLFSYMINNIKPEVMNAVRNDSGNIIGSGFSEWWEKTVLPKIALAHEGFIKDYEILLQNSYRDSIDGESPRNTFNPLKLVAHELAEWRRGASSRQDMSLEGFQKILKMPRSIPWMNGSNLVQSYIDELNLYLKILDRAYAKSAISDNYMNVKSPEDLKLFRAKLVRVKTMAYAMLNDFRNFNTKGTTWPKFGTRKDGTPYIIENAAPEMDLHQKYALLLFEIQGVYAALGFKNELVNTAAVETPYFKKKKDESTVNPMARLMLRIQNDETISAPYNNFVDSYDQETKEPAALTYGLGEGNFNVKTDHVRLKPEVQSVDLVNFKSNDRLTTAFITSNQLYALAEDLYKTISILDAATMNANFKEIEAPTGKTNSGSFKH